MRKQDLVQGILLNNQSRCLQDILHIQILDADSSCVVAELFDGIGEHLIRLQGNECRPALLIPAMSFDEISDEEWTGGFVDTDAVINNNQFAA